LVVVDACPHRLDAMTMPDPVKKYLEDTWKAVLAYSMRIVVALIVLLLGLRIIKMLCNALKRAMERGGSWQLYAEKKDEEAPKQINKELVDISVRCAGFGFKALLFFILCSILNISTSSLTAFFAMFMLAISLSMKEAFGNVAAGVVLLVLRPFECGDLVTVNNVFGRVVRIYIMHTLLHTMDNETVLIPNGLIFDNVLRNLSTESQHRVDVTVKLTYESYSKRAKEVLLEGLKDCEIILPQPAPTVLVSGTDEFGVQLSVRCWVETENIVDGHAEIRERMLRALKASNFGFPALAVYSSV